MGRNHARLRLADALAAMTLAVIRRSQPVQYFAWRPGSACGPIGGDGAVRSGSATNGRELRTAVLELELGVLVLVTGVGLGRR